MEKILIEVLRDYYCGLPAERAPPQGVYQFVRRMMELAFAKHVIARANDLLESEPLIRDPSPLQRAVYRAVAEYYLAAKAGQVDNQKRAETVGRIIAAQLSSIRYDQSPRRQAPRLPDRRGLRRHRES